MSDMPACPRCGPRKRNLVIESGHRLWYCHGCHMQFDDDPEEGGDFDDRDPSRRLERQEARRRPR